MSIECHPHHAFVADRGGRIIANLTDVVLFRWDRVRDDISEAIVLVSAPSPACSKILGDLRAGRHELVIYRGPRRVWEGPITHIEYTRTSVKISARDVMHYVYKTIEHSGYDNSYPNIDYVTNRMEKILRAELVRKESLDPPINVLPHLEMRTNEGTARTSKKTVPYQMTVWEDIDGMAARSGLDYSVIGRRIYANDVHDVIGRTQLMTDADFHADVIVTEYGSELATFSAVTTSENAVSVVGGIDPYYGEWELLNTAYGEGEDHPTAESREPTAVVLREQASRNLSNRNPTPVVVRVPDSATINPTTTALTMDDFVPGIRVPVRAGFTHRQVIQEQKLDKVRFEEDRNGEKISITLSPAPKDEDFDPEEEG